MRLPTITRHLAWGMLMLLLALAWAVPKGMTPAAERAPSGTEVSPVPIPGTPDGGTAPPNGPGKSEAELREILAASPNQREALEELAFLLLKRGDVPAADAAYSRLLHLAANDSGVALRYAMAKWHLRQEYEAQEALIAATQNPEAPPEVVARAKEVLQEIYRDDGLLKMLEKEGPEKLPAQAMEEIAALWQNLLQSNLLLGSADASKKQQLDAGKFFGDQSASSFLSLWRGFRGIGRGDYKTAKSELRGSLLAAQDEYTAFHIRAGIKLIDGMEFGDSFQQLLNIPPQVVEGMPLAKRRLALETDPVFMYLLARLEYLVLVRDFPEGTVLLGEFHPYVMNPTEKGKYLYELGDFWWAQGEFDRATQSFAAVQAVSPEPSTLSKAQLRLAQFAAKNGERDNAVQYAKRAAAIAPNQPERQREVGDFLLELGLKDEGVAYYEQAASVAETPKEAADSYRELMNLQQTLGDQAGYLTTADRYAEAMRKAEAWASANEKGIGWYYEGEVLASTGKGEQAFQAYTKATELLTDKPLLSDTYWKMAEYSAKQGDKEQAVRFAEQSAEVADTEWVYRRTGDFLFNLGLGDKASDYYGRAAKMIQAGDDLTANAVLADAYSARDDQAQFINYAGRYVSGVAKKGSEATPAEQGLAAYYRGKILASEGSDEGAFRSYERAVGLLTDPVKLSDAYMLMAMHKAEQGESKQAAEWAEKSLAATPESEWRLYQVASFYERVGMPDRAKALLNEHLARTETPKRRAEAQRQLAELSKRLGDNRQYLRNAKLYRDTVASPGFKPTPDEEGLAWYYQGEIHSAAGEAEPAYHAYTQAAQLLTDPALLSDTYWKLAEDAEKRGDKELAAEYAVRSLAATPNVDWKVFQVAGFYERVGMPDRAVALLEGHLKLTDTPKRRAEAIRQLAELHKRLEQQSEYLRYAKMYRDLILSPGFKPTADEQGLSSYYHGEVLAAAGDEEQAAAAYAKAAEQIRDGALLSDAYWRLAEHAEQRGDKVQAAEYARKSLAAAPDADWKVYQVAGFYDRVEMPESSLALLNEHLRQADTPKRRAEAQRQLAELHKRLENQGEYLRYAKMYRDTVGAADFKPTANEEGLAWYYHGEILSAAGEGEQAFQAYARATQLLTDRAVLSDAYWKMAEFAEKRGDKTLAADYARMSLAVLPDAEWKVYQVAAFYERLEMPEQSLALLHDQLNFADTPKRRAEALRQLAEYHRRFENTNEYLRYAGMYRDTVRDPDFKPTANEEGLAWYYDGEVLAADGNVEPAFHAYGKATELLTDNTILSDAYWKMAEHTEKRGDKALAAEYARKSLEALPDADWKLLQIAGFYERLEMPEQAVALLNDHLARADTPKRRAEALRLLAEFHKRHDHTEEYLRYAGAYRDTVLSGTFAATANEQGQAWFYHGEILTDAKDDVQACQAYLRAAQLLTDNELLSTTYLQLAENAEKRGNRPQAVEFARRSLAALPDADWRAFQIATFYERIGLPGEGVALLQDRVDRADTLKRKAAATRELAEMFRRLARVDEYLCSAKRYRELVITPGFDPTPNEEGISWYYCGEVMSACEDEAGGYVAYEKATQLVTDNGVHSDALLKMANYIQKLANIDQAVCLAEQSAVIGDADWSYRRTGDFLFKLDLPDKAFEYYVQSVQIASPDDHATAYSLMADAYFGRGDFLPFTSCASRYVEAVAEKGAAATAQELGLQAYYQGRIQAEKEDPAGTYRFYQRAVECLTDQGRLSEVYTLMAEYQAKLGNKDLAFSLADTGAMRCPDALGYSRAAAFFFAQNAHKNALDYFDRAAKSTNPADCWTVYARMADSYAGSGDTPRSLQCAAKFISVIKAKGETATRGEMGLAAYYMGKIIHETGDYDLAFKWYETSTHLLTDYPKLADAFLLMAGYKAEVEEIPLACEYAEKGFMVFPDDIGNIIRVAGFYVDHEMPLDGIRHYETFLARTYYVKRVTESYRFLAEIYRRIENYGMFIYYCRLYAETMPGTGYKPTRDEMGHRHFYQAEVDAKENRHDQAYQNYVLAAKHFVDKLRLSEAVIRQAEYQAQRDNIDEAARLAQLSSRHLDVTWRHTTVANFLGFLEKWDTAQEYFELALATAKTPREQAQAYEGMANFYKGRLKQELYIEYAEKYIQAIDELGKKATKRELGNRLYFCGEIYNHREQPVLANRAYTEAAAFVKDKPLLATLYFRMASYQAKHGTFEAAEELALAGASLLPNKRWAVGEAIIILGDIGRYKEAVQITEFAIYLDPENNKALYQTIAFMYFDKVGDRKTASHYHKLFIDHLYERNAREIQPVPRKNREELWYARYSQNGIDRTWGFINSVGLLRWGNGDYWTGMWNQIYRDYKLRNGMRGRLYLGYGGTFDSQSTTYHFIDEFTSLRSDWRGNWGNSQYLVLGATVIPFQKKWWNNLELWGEYQRGLAKNGYDDLRAGFKYGLGAGDDLRPSNNFWHYWKALTATWYSFRHGNVMSAGEVRQGFTYVNDCDRNLLFIPYAAATYNYDSANRDNPFGADAGVGMTIRKYFREDRYHTPRSNIELNLTYRWALTRGREPVFGASITTSF